MSTDTPKKVASNPTRDLAAQIYADLLVKAIELDGNSVKMGTSAENLVKLSVKLADAFEQVEAKVRSDALPDVNYKLDAESIAAWMK